MNMLLRITQLNNPVIMGIFLLSFLLVALFFNDAHYYAGRAVIDNTYSNVGQFEPVYHFILRALGIIDGGEFSTYDHSFSRVSHIFLYPFFGLFLAELTIFHLVKAVLRLAVWNRTRKSVLIICMLKVLNGYSPLLVCQA